MDDGCWCRCFVSISFDDDDDAVAVATAKISMVDTTLQFYECENRFEMCV